MCFFRFIFILALISQGGLLIYDSTISSEFEHNASKLKQVQYFGIATQYAQTFLTMFHLKLFFVAIHAFAVILIFKQCCYIWISNVLAFMFYIGIAVWKDILEKTKKDATMLQSYLPNIVFLAGLFMLYGTYSDSDSCKKRGKNIRKQWHQ